MSMSNCYCFDTCTLAAIATFRTHGVPEAVSLATPLWLRYLRAVYGSEPPLPFATPHLNYFYHRDTRWAISHPDVEWPMATCEWRGGALTTPNVNHIGLPLRRNMSRAPGQQRCPASQCARWRAEASGNKSTPQMQQKRQRITHAFLMPSTGGRESSGVVLFGDRYSRFAADDEMVEVMRMQTLNLKGTAGHEGANGNGCWLFPAAGSGVWVSVGRSWRAATERSLTATNSSFIRSSAAWRVRNAGSQAERLLHKHLQSATKERYPPRWRTRRATTVCRWARASSSRVIRMRSSCSPQRRAWTRPSPSGPVFPCPRALVSQGGCRAPVLTSHRSPRSAALARRGVGALHHSTQPLQRLAARRPSSLPLALQLEPKVATTATRGPKRVTKG